MTPVAAGAASFAGGETGSGRPVRRCDLGLSLEAGVATCCGAPEAGASAGAGAAAACWRRTFRERACRTLRPPAAMVLRLQRGDLCRVRPAAERSPACSARPVRQSRESVASGSGIVRCLLLGSRRPDPQHRQHGSCGLRLAAQTSPRGRRARTGCWQIARGPRAAAPPRRARRPVSTSTGQIAANRKRKPGSMDRQIPPSLWCCEGLRASGNAVTTELAAFATHRTPPARSESGWFENTARLSAAFVKNRRN